MLLGITALFALLPSFVRAAEVDAVVVWKSGGEKVVIMLDDQPKVFFSGEELVVQTLNGRVALPACEVRRFTYEGVAASGLSELRSGDVRVSLSDGRLRLAALESGSAVRLYGADGRQVVSVKAGADGSAVVDVRSYPAGTYVVKTSAGNFKIHKP